LRVRELTAADAGRPGPRMSSAVRASATAAVVRDRVCQVDETPPHRHPRLTGPCRGATSVLLDRIRSECEAQGGGKPKRATRRPCKAATADAPPPPPSTASTPPSTAVRQELPLCAPPAITARAHADTSTPVAKLWDHCDVLRVDAADSLGPLTRTGGGQWACRWTRSNPGL
jgi:hypothetical protein